MRRGARRGRTLIEQEPKQPKIEPNQESRKKERKHTRIYPASGLACSDNTPTATFVLFISLDLDRELQRCSSHWGFWRWRGALGAKCGEWGEMSGEEAIPCPSGPGSLIYTEASYMQVQTRVHRLPRKPGKPSEATDASYYSSRVAPHRAKGDLLLRW